MRYVVLFPECKNVHLIKRVGMIPYKMKELYGMDSAIACYRNEEQYLYLETEVKGLKLDFIRKRFNNSRLDGLCYLFENAKKIDVLQIFHIHSTRNYYWIELYKMLNPSGKVYLMLDTNYGLTNYEYTFGKSSLLRTIRKKIIKKCALISAETESTAYGLSKKWGINVEWINNGFYFRKKTPIEYKDKENIICTVGRIGTFQKNNEVLLQAFKYFSQEHPDWKLKIIGAIEPVFNEYIDNFMKENTELIDKIIFLGEIQDRGKLFNEYKKAKIFALTSRWEGFAVSFMEALSAGCYIISSDVYCAYDITDYQRFGTIFPIGDVIGLAKCLKHACENEDILKKTCEEGPSFVYENYDWGKNCEKIEYLLRKEENYGI